MGSSAPGSAPNLTQYGQSSNPSTLMRSLVGNTTTTGVNADSAPNITGWSTNPSPPVMPGSDQGGSLGANTSTTGMPSNTTGGSGDARPSPDYFPPTMAYPRPDYFPPTANNTGAHPQPDYFPNNTARPQPDYFPPSTNNTVTSPTNNAYPRPDYLPNTGNGPTPPASWMTPPNINPSALQGPASGLPTTAFRTPVQSTGSRSAMASGLPPYASGLPNYPQSIASARPQSAIVGALRGLRG